MHISVPVNVVNAIEYISGTELSPLISKGKVKVCYVGQQPNRNSTVITKETATEMGKKLPGSPIVGYFNEETQDFEGHNRELEVKDGKFRLVDTTKPYGFVPTDAKVWFQKFLDDGVEHEYLCTECLIWTGAYPESRRIIERGNNQSMELNNENSNGFWSNDDNSGDRFFIYSEALIEKLCILGEEVEPCFEGAQFKNQFSLENSAEFQEFKQTMFSMLTELQQTLKEGGFQKTMDNEKLINNMEENPAEEFEKKNKPDEECPAAQEEEKDKGSATEEKKDEPKADEEDDKKKKKYNLEEVTEYAELQEKYNELQEKYSALEQEKATLDTENAALKEFKLVSERQNKQAMIDSFYMLSDEDKKDVTEHIDTYSLDTIEAKLSVICVRNKVDFSLKNNKDEEPVEDSKPNGTFNLNAEADNAPAWIKAVKANEKK